MNTPPKKKKLTKATSGALALRKSGATLLARLNDLRIRFNADTYSMTQVKSFAAAQYGGGAAKREKFLRDWLAVYSEYGPKLEEAGLTMQAVDDGFIENRNLGIGPDAWKAYADHCIATADKQVDESPPETIEELAASVGLNVVVD